MKKIESKILNLHYLKEQKVRVFQILTLPAFCRNDILAQVSADSGLALEWKPCKGEEIPSSWLLTILNHVLKIIFFRIPV